ncbi:MAG: ABC transporter ATP-binding protein [Alicyclobacillaceae bacterium]|nr:ABC transporter ATP-binding protein [Alicyclobacillaceae bacterium]
MNGVWKWYGNRVVLREVSFGVRPGTTLGVIGPNGAGKSTLLRLLAGIERPDRGRVLLDGRPVDSFRRRDVARRVAVLSQEPHVPFSFSVYDTVMMGRHPHLRPLRGETARDRAVVERILEEMGLADIASRPVNDLSGGQRQLIALARTMAQEPEVLLLDEPTTFLDLGNQVKILDLVRRWQRTRRLTVVMVLHDLNLAALYADRVMLLHHARPKFLGTPAEVLTEENIEAVYGIRPVLIRHPETGVPQMMVRVGDGLLTHAEPLAPRIREGATATPGL